MFVCEIILLVTLLIVHIVLYIDLESSLVEIKLDLLIRYILNIIQSYNPQKKINTNFSSGIHRGEN